MEKFVISLIALTFGLVCNLILTPSIIKLSHKNKWYDIPDRRKIHTGLIPRLGGAGLFLSTAISVSIVITLLFLLNLYHIFHRFVSNELILSLIPDNNVLFFVFIPLALIHLTGLIDDFHNLKAIFKFILQLFAASLVTAGGFVVKTFTIPYLGTINLGVLGFPITVLWIVGITNALNLVDGMDGLAGGIAAFASLSLGVIMILKGSILAGILSFAITGSIIGFLVFNFPPAKIFMGDSGSLFLGFALSIIPLIPLKYNQPSEGILIAAITLFMIPIIDTASAIIRRIREKRPIYSPDRKHLHHRLLDIGMNERKILTIIYSFSVYLSIVSITSMILPKETNIYFVLIIWVGSMFAYILFNYIESKKHGSINSNRVNNSYTNISGQK